MTKELPSKWQAAGASVRGAAHIRAGMPNQDAIAWLSPPDPHQPILLALADGHGSPRYLRSHRGAKLAVRLALDLLEDFATQQADEPNLSAVKSAAEDHLPRAMVRSWQDAVVADIADRPFDKDDWKLLAKRTDPALQPWVLEHPIAAYGSTLLTALITARYMLLLQLGDGDIITVDAKGNVDRPPFPQDPRLMANQTTSLCGSKAWADVRMHFLPLAAKTPDLVMLSTDGYANSFADEAGFRQAGVDLLHAVRQNGIHRIPYKLKSWLRVTSEMGSGDDITVGLICRTPL